MKRLNFTKLLFALTLGLGIFNFNKNASLKEVRATNSPTITVGSITTPTPVGSNISLPVTITNNPGFAAAVFEVIYDSDVFAPQEPFFSLGSAVSDSVLNNETNMTLTSGTYVLLSADDNNFVNNGNIFNINFSIIDSASVSTTEVGLKLRDNQNKNFCDLNGNAIDVTFVSGSVAVSGLENSCQVTNGGTNNYPTKEYSNLGEAIQVNSTFNANYNIKMLRNSNKESVNYGRFSKLDLNSYTINELNFVGKTYSVGMNGSHSIYAGDSNVGGITNGKIKTLNSSLEKGAKSVYITLGSNLIVENINLNNLSQIALCSGVYVGTLQDDSTASHTITDGIIDNYIDNSMSGTERTLTFSGNIRVNSLTKTGTRPLEITGGTFGFDPTEYVASATENYSYDVVKTGSQEWKVVRVDEPVFVIGNTNYYRYYEASQAYQEGDTIVLGSAYKDQEIYFTKSPTLDLNGHTLVNCDISLSGSKTTPVKIINSSNVVSKVTNDTSSTIHFNFSGDVLLEDDDIIFENTSSSGVIFGNVNNYSYYSATITIKNGTYLGKLTNYHKIVIHGGSFSINPSTLQNVTLGSEAKIIFNSETNLYDVVEYIWDDGTIISEPTCEQSGQIEYHDLSGTGETRIEELEALGHDYQFSHVEWADDNTAKVILVCTRDPSHFIEYDAYVSCEIVTAETCTTPGLKIYKVSYKGHSYSNTVEIPPHGHTEVIDEAVAPTSKETGLTQGSHCSECGTILVAQEVVPATSKLTGCFGSFSGSSIVISTTSLVGFILILLKKRKIEFSKTK